MSLTSISNHRWLNHIDQPPSGLSHTFPITHLLLKVLSHLLLRRNRILFSATATVFLYNILGGTLPPLFKYVEIFFVFVFTLAYKALDFNKHISSFIHMYVYIYICHIICESTNLPESCFHPLWVLCVI